MNTTKMTNYQNTIAQLTSDGWEVISDGPTGVQLRAPKKMTGLDKGALVLGILLLPLYGFGLFLILIALIDYAFLTKRETRFLARQ